MHLNRIPVSVSKKDPASYISTKKSQAIPLKVLQRPLQNSLHVVYESIPFVRRVEIKHMTKGIVLVLGNNGANHICIAWHTSRFGPLVRILFATSRASKAIRNAKN